MPRLQANSNIAHKQGGDYTIYGGRTPFARQTYWQDELAGIATGSPQWLGKFDHFEGDSLKAEWATNLSTGATIAPTSPTVAGGAIAFATDTDDDDFATLALGLHWLVSNGDIWFETRVKNMSAITLRAVEIGLSDALSETNGLAFSSHDATPTAVATDAAIFGYNTDDSMTTWSCLSVNGGGTPQYTTASSTYAPVAGTWQKFAVNLTSAGVATFLINDVVIATHSAAVATTGLLTPWISLKSLSGAIKTIQCDYVLIHAPYDV